MKNLEKMLNFPYFAEKKAGKAIFSFMIYDL